MSKFIETGLNSLTVVIGACVVTLTVASFRTPENAGRIRDWAPREEILDSAAWKSVRLGSRWIGPTDAANVIVVSEDFECPFCR
jgi:hypothetical protein